MSAKLKARVVFDVVCGRYVGEVVDADGNLVCAYFRNTWDDALAKAKERASHA